MITEFCSLLAAKEGEPIYGTAPEKDSAIFVPSLKGDWHGISPKVKLAEIAANSDLGQTIETFKHPLILFYTPNKRTGDFIYVSDSSTISCFSLSGVRTKKQIKHLYAICTDGVKDACCAKFGIQVAKAFSGKLAENQFSLLLETSHIGGCRFAATAVCFPSGNSYGRILPEAVDEIKRSEETGTIVAKFFRGNVFVSEIHCWIMRYSMENFNYVPTPAQTEVVKQENRFHITITPLQRTQFEFDMFHHQLEFKLFSGCSNIDSGRSIIRSIFDLEPNTFQK